MFKALSALGRLMVRIPIPPSNDNKMFLYSMFTPVPQMIFDLQFAICNPEKT
jgi:hypothetical protein